MIAVTFEVEYRGVLAEPRGWKTVRNNAYKDAGKFWHNRFADGHFSNAGARKYGYRKRTSKYVKRKWKEKKHTNPMVWSGDTKRDVMTKWRVQGLKKGGAKVVINAPGLNRRPKHGKVRLTDEMGTIIPAEWQQMSNHANKQADKGLKKLLRTKRRRKRIRG